MCSDETCAHLEGMLDRDLRTAKSLRGVTRRQEAPKRSQCYRRRGCLVVRTRFCECSLRNLCHHLRKSLHKFKQAVTVLLWLSYVFNLPTSSSHPIARAGMSSKGSQNTQLKAILDQAEHNTYQAENYYAETFVQSSNHPDVTLYDRKRIHFFFEHTQKDFDFPTKSNFDESVLKEDTTVKDFTRVFYDCFLRFNATFDMIGENNNVTNKLKVLLEEMQEYIVTEGWDFLKEKYDEAELKLDADETEDNTATRWLRNLVIYRDFVVTMQYIVQGYRHFLK